MHPVMIIYRLIEEPSTNAIKLQEQIREMAEDYNEFYKYLYPFQGDPLFYVHMNVDHPFQHQGVMFFPRLAHEMDQI